MNGTSNITGSHTCPAGPQHISIPVLICLILLLGLLLNIFSMYVFIFRIPEWRSGTLLQFHLTISDIIICPLAPFVVTYFSLGGHWPFGSFLCRLKIMLLAVHFTGSILFLTLISVHRYVSVVYHSQDSCMKQKDFVKKLCIGIWVALLIKGSLIAFVVDTSTPGNGTLCLSIHQTHNVEVYFTINFILLIPGFLIPFTVSVFCYARLVRSVSGINLCHLKGRLMKSKSRKMVAVCLLIFGLCFMPINVIRTAIVVVKKFFPSRCGLLSQLETAYYVSWILSSSNCCLDPLLYCFASQNFTKAIRNSLRKIGITSLRKTAQEVTRRDSSPTTNINNQAVTQL